MQGYDISRLQIPMGDTDSMIKGPPPEEPMMYRRDMMPVGSEYSHTSFVRSSVPTVASQLFLYSVAFSIIEVLIGFLN